MTDFCFEINSVSNPLRLANGSGDHVQGNNQLESELLFQGKKLKFSHPADSRAGLNIYLDN